MKRLKNLIRIFLVLILVFLLSSTLRAQEYFAKLEKNKNIQAKGLIHQLNETKDTLLLKSEKKINYLYSINKDQSRGSTFYIDQVSYKLPLNRFAKGRHVLVAVQSPMRIVFVVEILEDISKNVPETTIAKKVATSESLKKKMPKATYN